MEDIKTNVIQYILQKDTADYRRGQILLRYLNPQHPALSLPETPNNRKILVAEFGARLRSGDFTIYEPAPVPENVREAQPSPTMEETEIHDDTPDNYDLTTEARITIDLDRMTKIQRGIANKMIQASSDRERMKLYKDADAVQKQITLNKKYKRTLEKGSPVKYTNTYFNKPEESIFEVPDNILELERKYRHLMSRRSKAKSKVIQMEARHGQSSFEHEQSSKDWKLLDEAVKHLKSKINECTKAA